MTSHYIVLRLDHPTASAELKIGAMYLAKLLIVSPPARVSRSVCLTRPRHRCGIIGRTRI